jgi:hypothetical protein
MRNVDDVNGDDDVACFAITIADTDSEQHSVERCDGRAGERGCRQRLPGMRVERGVPTRQLHHV